MRILYVLVFLICVINAKAQYNLVPNGNFEDTSACPTSDNQLNYAIGWINPIWTTPDYFNVCNPPLFFPPNTYIPNVGVPENAFGFQVAKSGDGYAGIGNYTATPHREYAEIKLAEKLIIDKKYVFSCYLSIPEKFGYGCKIQALFSDTLISVPDSIHLRWLIPQLVIPYSIIDKENWVLWQDTITSINGGEEYLVIGNFLDVENSDTVYSGSGEGSYKHKSYYYIDDVSLIPLDSLTGINELEKVKFEVYPNPTKERLTIETEFREQTRVRLFDITGREVLTTVLNAEKTTLYVSGFAAGVYTAVLLQGDVVVGRRKILVE